MTLSHPMSFEFPRSATLPELEDPRAKDPPRQTQNLPPSNPIEKWASDVTISDSPVMKNSSTNGSPVLPSSSLPPRVSSAQGRRVASSPLSSPVFPSSGKMTSSPTAFQSLQPSNRSTSAQSRPPAPPAYTRQSTIHASTARSTMPRRAGPATLPYLVSHPRIASALLPYLSINSFLSLMGYSDNVRRQFTGEMVGKWVMKEWGVMVDKERGRTWPGLTVWEGFCEW